MSLLSGRPKPSLMPAPAGAWSRVGGPADVGLGMVRVALGIALVGRGWAFLAHREVLLAWIDDATGWFWPTALGHLVVALHLGGGALLVLGLLTRWAAAVQLPILLGATFLVHWQEGLLSAGQSLELSAGVLVLLLILTVFGGGRPSLDAWLRREGGREISRSAGPPTH